jgi:hypothetical protein
MANYPPIDLDVERNEDGEITHARIRFGPHFVLQVRDEQRKVMFELVYTHHGFRADASALDGELEQIINEIRSSHPEAAID